jgi:undecaprenyl-diphosphatase
MEGPTRADEHLSWREQMQALDAAVYAAVAVTPTPAFDRALGALSRAADHSKLWVTAAALLAAAAPAMRRAGLAAVVDVDPQSV